jgi:excinuclease ABC subunit B
MYADGMSDSMKKAIVETERRRRKQKKYNDENGITPKTIEKSVRAIIEATKVAERGAEYYRGKSPLEMTQNELSLYVKSLEKDMKQAASDLQFERAAELRDIIFEYKCNINK